MRQGDAQLRLPFTAVDPPPSGGLSIGAGAARFVVHLVRMRRARRYVMRLRPDGALRITIPRGGSRAEALRFAERHLPWALRQRARQRENVTDHEWVDGTRVLLDGMPQPIVICRADGAVVARLGRISAVVAPDTTVRASLQRAIRTAAARELPVQLLALAAAHGFTVRRVTVRDQRSRWGSCSPSGTIALNYRLLLMPPEVRRYILVHELAHLLHPNHSRRFWACVESMDPGFRGSERWLKSQGQTLF
ncbi:MAG TPA: SprT family zinc-dependent metalloprotease [Vicinamibacterales bacterium]|nr:SprT family zinc-dependent metalloprotease [Vicinamibacterales bacterium]